MRWFWPINCNGWVIYTDFSYAILLFTYFPALSRNQFDFTPIYNQPLTLPYVPTPVHPISHFTLDLFFRLIPANSVRLRTQTKLLQPFLQLNKKGTNESDISQEERGFSTVLSIHSLRENRRDVIQHSCLTNLNVKVAGRPKALMFYTLILGHP